MSKYAIPRAAYVQPDAERYYVDEHGTEVWFYLSGSKPAALGFHGKAMKPDFRYYFASPEQREAYVARYLAAIEARRARKLEAAQARKAWRHDVKVGDVFRASWGYDQTNVDYYEVVALVGETMAEIREIGARAEETGFMCGSCVPTPGQYLDQPPRRVRIQGGPDMEPYFAAYSHANARRIKPLAEVAGAKVYHADYWSAYA